MWHNNLFLGTALENSRRGSSESSEGLEYGLSAGGSERQSGEGATDQISGSQSYRLRNLASMRAGDGRPLRISGKSKATTAEH